MISSICVVYIFYVHCNMWNELVQRIAHIEAKWWVLPQLSMLFQNLPELQITQNIIIIITITIITIIIIILLYFTANDHTTKWRLQQNVFNEPRLFDRTSTWRHIRINIIVRFKILVKIYCNVSAYIMSVRRPSC